jgi:hypothetical protein
MKSANVLRLVTTLFLLGGLATHGNAQQTRVRTLPPPRPAPPAPPPAAPVLAGVAAGPPRPAPAAPSNLRVTYIGVQQVDLRWDAPTGADTTINYIVERCDGEIPSCNGHAAVFNPLNAGFPIGDNNYIDKTVGSESPYVYRVHGIVVVGGIVVSPPSQPTQLFFVTTTKLTCLLFPVRGGCMDFGADPQDNINTFFQTNGQYSFLGQVRSTYNQASGSTTAAADFASLNFKNGMQVTVTANAQIGSAPATPPTSATTPTLSASGAAQATQNLLYGGNFVVSELYPLFAAGAAKLSSPGGLGLQVDFVAKEGTDIQNFKSGTNVNISSPPFHGSAHMDGYIQYNSINLIPNTTNFAGALFLGGSYGYNYISHDYAADYGFGRRFNNGMGQISFGIVVNGVARITVSRAFGPSQTYFNSATTNPTTPTTVNNFKAWSFGIVYQSPAPSK